MPSAPIATRAARRRSGSESSIVIERPVRRDHFERLDLGRDVLKALAGPVSAGRDGAGDRLAVDVAEVLERDSVRVEHSVEVVEHRARLDLEESRLPVEVELAGEPVEADHRPLGQGAVGERVAGGGSPNPEAARDRVRDRLLQRREGPRPLDRRRLACLLPGPIRPPRHRAARLHPKSGAGGIRTPGPAKHGSAAFKAAAFSRTLPPLLRRGYECSQSAVAPGTSPLCSNSRPAAISLTMSAPSSR